MHSQVKTSQHFSFSETRATSPVLRSRSLTNTVNVGLRYCLWGNTRRFRRSSRPSCFSRNPLHVPAPPLHLFAQPESWKKELEYNENSQPLDWQKKEFTLRMVDGTEGAVFLTSPCVQQSATLFLFIFKVAGDYRNINPMRTERCCSK